MKYYIISGEPSGDLHGSMLISEIRKTDHSASFRCWGGDLMKAEGADLVKHYKDLAFMGFAEVLMNIRTILRNISFCKKDILDYKPDALILIDYPGFNLRIASFAKSRGFKVFYYISPQIWAWNQSRGWKIKRMVDKMFVILPFEKEFYKKFNYEVEFVGHPLLDAIGKFSSDKKPFGEFAKENGLNQKPLVAIVPGSRKQEIKKMLPVMLSVIRFFPDYQFAIAGAPSIPAGFYEKFRDPGVPVLFGKTYELLQQSSAALVTSGTATLETALFGVPEVVCYKGNYISYLIARQLVKIKFISLVNLIMENEPATAENPVVKELIQGEFNSENLRAELEKILNNPSFRNQMKNNFLLLRNKLGGGGASAITARLLLKTLSGSN